LRKKKRRKKGENGRKARVQLQEKLGKDRKVRKAKIRFPRKILEGLFFCWMFAFFCDSTDRKEQGNWGDTLRVMIPIAHCQLKDRDVLRLQRMLRCKSNGTYRGGVGKKMVVYVAKEKILFKIFYRQKNGGA